MGATDDTDFGVGVDEQSAGSSENESDVPSEENVSFCIFTYYVFISFLGKHFSHNFCCYASTFTDNGLCICANSCMGYIYSHPLFSFLSNRELTPAILMSSTHFFCIRSARKRLYHIYILFIFSKVINILNQTNTLPLYRLRN